MQKKLIALAVAGLVSAPAFAQSNVTIYGIMDAGVETISGKTLDATTGQNESGRVNGLRSGGIAGSRIGFRGAEDLGNGLKAIFTWEQGLAIDNGTGWNNGARQAFVGVSGGFGTVVAGRLQSPGREFQAKYVSGKGGLTGATQDTLTTLGGQTIDSAHRLNNTVAYVSPNFSGLTARVAYSFLNEQDGVDDGFGEREEKGNVFGASLDYANGPLSVGAVYHRANDLDDTSRVGLFNEQTDEWALGAQYDFGIVKLNAIYQEREIDFTNNVNYEDKIWTLGGTMPVGAAGAVALSYSRATGDDLVAGTDNEASTWALSYTHALSKRTTGYVAYNRLNVEDGYIGAGVVPAVRARQGAFGSDLGIVGDENYNLFIVGVNHTF